jgi:hypothetical protein
MPNKIVLAVSVKKFVLKRRRLRKLRRWREKNFGGISSHTYAMKVMTSASNMQNWVCYVVGEDFLINKKHTGVETKFTRLL